MFATRSDTAPSAGEDHTSDDVADDETLARVLLVDADPAEATLVESCFGRDAEPRVELVHVTRFEDVHGRLEGGGYAVAVLDLSILPGDGGLEGLAALHAEHAELPLVALTAAGNRLLQARAFAHGAADCVAKDELDGPRLAHCVRAAVLRSRMQIALELAQREALASEMRLLEMVLEAAVGTHTIPTKARRAPETSAPAARELHETRAAVASRASELQARAHVVDAAVAVLRENFGKMRELVLRWPCHHAHEDVRAVLLELMEVSTGTLIATHHEVVLIERTSSAMIRQLGRGRVHGRNTLDGLVQRACERVRERLSAHVRLHFEGCAPGVLVESGDEVVALTENLLRGLGGLARHHAPYGVDLEVETHARAGEALLAITLHAARGRRDIGAKIVEAIVAEAREGYAELAAATRELRALSGGLRVGERRDGGVHLELSFPSGE